MLSCFYIIRSACYKSPVWSISTSYSLFINFFRIFKDLRSQGDDALRRCDLHGLPFGDVRDRRDDTLLLP